MIELTKTEKAELYNIGNNMPVFAGDVVSKDSARSLCEKGLAMKYEDDYVLTEAGKSELKELKMAAAKKIAEKSAVYRWLYKERRI